MSYCYSYIHTECLKNHCAVATLMAVMCERTSAKTMNVGAERHIWTYWQHAVHEQNTSCILCETVTSCACSTDSSVMQTRACVSGD